MLGKGIWVIRIKGIKPPGPFGLNGTKGVNYQEGLVWRGFGILQGGLKGSHNLVGVSLNTRGNFC